MDKLKDSLGLFTCPVCSYCTPDKSNYTKHTQRKTPCSSSDNPDLVKCPACNKNISARHASKHMAVCKQVPGNTCDMCFVTFSSRQAKCNHRKRCKVAAEAAEAAKAAETAEAAGPSRPDRTLGSEEVQFLLSDTYKIARQDLQTLIMLIFFNKDRPENHTVRKPNKKDQMVDLHQNTGWNSVNIQTAKTAVQDILQTKIGYTQSFSMTTLANILYTCTKKGLTPESDIMENLQALRNLRLPPPRVVTQEEHVDTSTREFALGIVNKSRSEFLERFRKRGDPITRMAVLHTKALDDFTLLVNQKLKNRQSAYRLKADIDEHDQRALDLYIRGITEAADLHFVDAPRHPIIK